MVRRPSAAPPLMMLLATVAVLLASPAAAQLSWYGTTGLKAGAVPAGPSPPNGFTTSIWDMLPSGHGVAETLLGGVQRLYLTQDAGNNWSELPRPGGTNFKIAAENIVMLDTQSVLLTTYNQDDRAANKLVPTEIWRWSGATKKWDSVVVIPPSDEYGEAPGFEVSGITTPLDTGNNGVAFIWGRRLWKNAAGAWVTVNPAKPDNGEIHDIYRTNFFPMDAPLVLVSADPFALEAGKSVGINMVVARNRYRMWCTVHGSGEIWEWSNPTGGSAGVEWRIIRQNVGVATYLEAVPNTFNPPRLWAEVQEDNGSTSLAFYNGMWAKKHTVAAGHEITSYAAAPGYCAIVEWKEGAGGRLLQWFAGGTKFNPVFSVTDPTAAYGRCDGHAFGFSVFAYHSRKDSVVRAWVRGANNKWTAIDATEVAKGYPKAALDSLKAIDGNKAVLTTSNGDGAVTLDK